MGKGERERRAEGHSDTLHSVPIGPIVRVVSVAGVGTKVALQPEEELRVHAAPSFHGEDTKGSALVSVELPPVAIMRNLAPARLVSRVPILQGSVGNMAGGSRRCYREVQVDGLTVRLSDFDVRTIVTRSSHASSRGNTMSVEEMRLLHNGHLAIRTTTVSMQAGKDSVTHAVMAQCGPATHIIRLARARTAHMGMITEVGGNVLTGIMRVVCRVAREAADNVVAPVALRHKQGANREA